MSFLTLSTETIDQIFEDLFPKATLEPHWAWTTSLVPKDLLHCRSVCRRFKGLATRWIWRRLGLNSTSDHFQDVCKFLIDHPDIGTNVRRLSLYADKPDNDMDNFITDIMPLLTCLRYLRLSMHRTWSFSLSSITGLHTLILEELDCSLIGLKETTKLTSIKHLHLRKCINTHMLWASLPSIEVCHCAWQTEFLLPWQLLREVTIVGDGEARYNQLALEFQNWRQDPANIDGSPLAELALAADVSVHIDIDNIVRVFGGQPLKKLLVSFFDRMSIFRLQQIVKTFPELEDLMLLAADPDANPFWEGSIVEFAQTLRPLKNLRVFCWNYTWDPYSEESTSDTESESEPDDDGLYYVDGLPVTYWEGSEYNPESPSRSHSPAEQQSDVSGDEATSTTSASSVRSSSKSRETTESNLGHAPAANTVASRPFMLNGTWFTRCRGFASCLGEHCPQLQRINFHNVSGIAEWYSTGVVRFERDSGLDAGGKGKMRFRGTFDMENTTNSWNTKSDI